MASELKDTLNLPKTGFAMKANLPQNEPKRLEFWKRIDIYRRIREARKDSPKYLLHDGPPYANGEIHLQETEIPLDELVAKLQAISKTGYDERIFIRGDKATNYGAAMKVMGLIQAAGYKNIGLISLQEQDQ